MRVSANEALIHATFRHRRIAATFAVTAFLLAAGPTAGAQERVVYPTGVPTSDVANLQAAADAGGSVRLKATNLAGQPTAFELGDEGFVSLTRDVALLGEVAHDRMTLIHGGRSVIRSTLPVSVTVRGIHFDEPKNTTVRLDSPRDAQIMGNRITRHRVLAGANSSTAILMFDGANPVTGSVGVADNIISDSGWGIIADFTFVGASLVDLRITGNETRNNFSGGIWGSVGNGSSRIERNIVGPLTRGLIAILADTFELADPLLAAGANCNIFEASALGLLDRVVSLADAEPGLIGSYSLDGFTPLHLAAFFGHLDLVADLLRRGAGVNAVATNTTFASSVTPLHSAIARGGPGIVQALLDAGADVSLRNGVGHTPIFEAAFNGDVEAARMLLDAGADPNPTADNGETPLSVALDRKHEPVADLLRARGAQG